ncbi:MAG: alpha/beta fold hydrolase [bacterium]|nr:alpha/beta fold hydrolase [bacterium]
MRRLILFFLTALIASGCGDNAPTDIEESTLPSQGAQIAAVNFETSDGFTLVGTWFTPTQSTGPRPVVILLHMFNQNHSEWFPFAPDLVVENGYVVLAFDMRGHGLSTLRNGQPFPITGFTAEDINAMPNDVEAAIAWIKTRPEADPTRIGIIGADIGANIAFVSAGTLPEIKATVSISPEYRGNRESEILVGTNIAGFQPKNILYVASFGDQYTYTSSETMSQLTQGTTRVIGYQGVAHGVQLLDDQTAWNDILNWLKANL